MYGAGVDPSDGGDIALMYRDINEQPRETNNVKLLNYLDFKNIDDALNQ
jgi:hypothetical protein